MALPPGSTISLTWPRRFICDLLHASRQVPLVAIERQLQVGDLVDARKRLTARPSWFALFLKAYALVAKQTDELRRSYLSFPWPRLHQHACNVANVAITRRVDDEDAVLGFQIRHPEQLPLSEIDALIQRARTAPIEHVPDFRRLRFHSRLPRPLRRLIWWAGLNAVGDWRAKYAGTFGVTGVAALGSASLHTLSPLTTTLTYGVLTEYGNVPVRLFYDHRVLDGVQPAKALKELEETLCGPIVEELRGPTRHEVFPLSLAA